MRHCECGNTIPLYKMIDGKRRSLRNRSKCLECQPFNSSIYRRRYKPEERDEQRRKRNCKKQRNWRQRVIEKTGQDPIEVFRQRRKAFVISRIGGACQICGYKRCQRNLTFHHIQDKEFGLSERGFQYSAKKLVPEIHKCVLVCHNCHGEIHDDLISKTKLTKCNKQVRSVIKISDSWPTSKV